MHLAYFLSIRYNLLKQRGVTGLDRINIMVLRPGSVSLNRLSETFASIGGKGLFSYKDFPALLISMI